MSSIWSNGGLTISLFGESHGKGIGVVIDGLPGGQPINNDKIAEFMKRRAPGRDKTSTPRKESDAPQIISGVYAEKTTGTPLCAVIGNKDTHSSDYSEMTNVARPGHADYTGFLKYKGFNDINGGGHFSGRLTAPLVFAGAVCGQIIERMGIYTGAHVLSIMDCKDKNFDTLSLTRDDILAIRSKRYPIIDDSTEKGMLEIIETARKAADSVGGIIECATIGLPAGIGSPMFEGLENIISSLVFGVPAVKGIEFGAGFGVNNLFGSQNNDEFYTDTNGNIKTYTNNHGGILGGISSGMPVSLKVALKPTPSIGKPQRSVDYVKRKDTTITVKGRHDPCILMRAVPVIESCVNIALLSVLLNQGVL